MPAGRVFMGLALFFALGFGSTGIAQDGSALQPRTISTLSDSYNLGGVNLINMPDTGDNIDISAFTTEAGEPGASCSGASLLNTAWFKIYHPGGTLDINTAYGTGSNFNTLVQLFTFSGAGLASLSELGCDDDSGGGPGANDARLIMPGLPSAQYLARISCVSACGGTTDLALSVSYTPNEPPPPNNHVTDAAPINIGKIATTVNVEHATLEADENTVFSTCRMYNSVWYTMTVPYTGRYSFNTFGSLLTFPNDSVTDTEMGVYTSSDGANFANFTEAGCGGDFAGGLFSALPFVSLNADDLVYVRVGTYRSANLLNGAYYRLKVSPVMLPGVFTNGSFSTGLLEPWTLSVISPVDGIVDTYRYDDTYSVRMSGAPGKTNKLKQKWSPLAHNMTLAKNSTALALFYYSTNGTVSSSVKAILKITYSNGIPPTVASSKLLAQNGVNQWEYGAVLASVKSPKVAAVTLMIKNKSPAGQFYFDHGLLYIYGSPAREAKSADGVLPLPAAPLTLRSMN